MGDELPELAGKHIKLDSTPLDRWNDFPSRALEFCCPGIVHKDTYTEAWTKRDSSTRERRPLSSCDSDQTPHEIGQSSSKCWWIDIPSRPRYILTGSHMIIDSVTNTWYKVVSINIRRSQYLLYIAAMRRENGC